MPDPLDLEALKRHLMAVTDADAAWPFSWRTLAMLLEELETAREIANTPAKYRDDWLAMKRRAKKAEAERTVAWGELADQIRVAEVQASRAIDAEAIIAAVQELYDDDWYWDNTSDPEKKRQLGVALRGDHA